METIGRILPNWRLNPLNGLLALSIGSGLGWLTENYLDLAPAKRIHWPSMVYATASTGLAIWAAVSLNEIWMLLSIGALAGSVSSGLVYMTHEKKDVIHLGKPI